MVLIVSPQTTHSGVATKMRFSWEVGVNRLVDGDHNIDCKITGIGAMMLKSEFVKKA